MLLVTFHGAINNVYVYETPSGSLVTDKALQVPHDVTLSELRTMVVAGNFLYVANGAKAASTVLCYQVPTSGSSFSYVSTVIGPQLSKEGDFETAIAHPFGIAFEGSGTCYVSNQDTNVVAQVALTSNGETGSLRSGCQSAYIKGLYPNGKFLDGTYVASQVGKLHQVSVATTAVPASQGGLGVKFDHSGKVQNKVLNSVRDVAIANGILFVCDEPDRVVNMYSLVDGTFLGASNTLAGGPTHLAISNGGLYVSAGSPLCWGELPAGIQGASLTLQALTVPGQSSATKIGGISFDGATAYVPFQTGTGGVNPGGAIYTYQLTPGAPSSPPALSNATLLTKTKDTPEFVLYLPQA
jgi:hypothetical protein